MRTSRKSGGKRDLPGQGDLFFENDNRRPRRRNPRPPVPAAIRAKVAPRDVPATKAARRLHLTLDQFREKLPELIARGFPAADRTTGMFDLVAIDAWQDARHPPVLLTGDTTPRDAREVVNDRLSRL